MKVTFITAADPLTGRVCAVPFQGEPIHGMEPKWFPDMKTAYDALSSLPKTELTGIGMSRQQSVNSAS